MQSGYNGNSQNRDSDSPFFTFSFAEGENLDKFELESDVFKKKKLESGMEAALSNTIQTSTNSVCIAGNNNSTYQSQSDAVFTYWPVPCETADGLPTGRIDIDRAIATMARLQAARSNINSATSASPCDADPPVESQNLKRYLRFNSSTVHNSGESEEIKNKNTSAEESLIKKEEMRKLMMERIARLKFEKLLRDKELAATQLQKKIPNESLVASEQRPAANVVLETTIPGESAAVAETAGTGSTPRSQQSDEPPQAHEQVLRTALLKLRKRPFDAIKSPEGAGDQDADVEGTPSKKSAAPSASDGGRSEGLDLAEGRSSFSSDNGRRYDSDLVTTKMVCDNLGVNFDGKRDSTDSVTAISNGAEISRGLEMSAVRKSQEYEDRLQGEEDDEVTAL